MDTAEFEAMLTAHRRAVERFVRYRMPESDADDVLQETYIAAYESIGTLRTRESFLPWLLSIARYKCRDYYRSRRSETVPLEAAEAVAAPTESSDIAEAVRGILETLTPRDRDVLMMTFFDELPQTEIAKRLGIPVGTVKSRLYSAKRRFREAYSCSGAQRVKGDFTMKKNEIKTSLPEVMPAYTITKSEKPPFAVRHEELPGMLIIPRKDEKLTFGMYDIPGRKMSGVYYLEVSGEIVIHGIRGTEISSDYTDSDGTKEHSVIFAQLTDSHCRYLGGMSRGVDGVCRVTTFLDGDVFTDAYGIGEDNCGFEVERRPKGLITMRDDELMTLQTDDVSDIVGRYDVNIGGKLYDTVRLVDIQSGNDSYMLSESYIDKNGRTVIWRRFNRDDWAYKRYGKKWCEMLPDNERLTVNGEVYVHWYDCISDYIIR